MLVTGNLKLLSIQKKIILYILSLLDSQSQKKNNCQNDKLWFNLMVCFPIHFDIFSV